MSNIIFDNFLSDNWLDALGRESSIQSLSKPIRFINNEINLNKKIFPDINKIFELFQEKNIEMVSMFTELKDKSDLKNPNVVKVSVVDSVAQDFYRKETNIDKKAYIHLGVYGFKFSTLKKIINLPKSENEIALKLEQMRAMDNNILIHMIKSVAKIHLGVDTNEDLELANKLIGND